ncbi:unnamed protein product [Boreogadus saida]
MWIPMDWQKGNVFLRGKTPATRALICQPYSFSRTEHPPDGPWLPGPPGHLRSSSLSLDIVSPRASSSVLDAEELSHFTAVLLHLEGGGREGGGGGAAAGAGGEWRVEEEGEAVVAATTHTRTRSWGLRCSLSASFSHFAPF